MTRSRTVTICHQSLQPARVALRNAGRMPATWVYLAADPARGRAWEADLGPGMRRIEIADHLEQANARLRKPFCDWVDALSNEYGADRHWWFSQIAERNTIISPFFLHACYLEVARQLFDGDPPALVVAESSGLVLALREIARARGFAVRMPGRVRVWLEPIGLSVRLIATAAYFVIAEAGRRLAARRSRSGPPAIAPGPKPHRRVLMRTFFHESQLAPDHVFRDRYVPGLEAWLTTKGAEVWVLPSVAENQVPLVSKYRWMRSAQTRFLIPEDWLHWPDYLDALWCSAKAWWRPRRTPDLLGLNLRPLVAEEQWRQATGNRYRRACVISHLPRRLAAGGFKPDLVIDWYENQVTDKAFIIGCRDAFPGAITTAVHNTCLFESSLHTFPTPAEVERGVIAQRLFCNGPLAARLFSESSGSKAPTRVGCSFRYQHLWATPQRRDRTPDCLAVLVAFSFVDHEIVDLLDLIEPLCLQRANTSWALRPHPDSPPSHFEHLLDPRVKGRVQMANGSLQECLSQADILVSAGTGVVVEAAALGVPVVMSRSRTALTYDPLAWFPGLAARCASSESLGRELDRIQSLTDSELDALRVRGRVVRDGVFAPVTEEALLQFLPQGGFGGTG